MSVACRCDALQTEKTWKNLVSVVLLGGRVLSQRTDALQFGSFVTSLRTWGRLLRFQGLQTGA